jgi:hypothetical protein
MPAAATTAAAAEAPSATTATALFLRTSFIDDEIAPAKVLTVHGIDRSIRFFVIGNFDESKTARLAREPIANEIDSRGINASLREKIMQRILRCGKRKITNIELLHLRTPSARNLTAYRGARWKAVTILTGSPENRSHLHSKAFGAGLETWVPNRALQRSVASSKKLTGFAMRNY